MLVGVYLGPRRSSTPSKYAESGNYEAFVMVCYCHFINEVMFLVEGETKPKLENLVQGALDK